MKYKILAVDAGYHTPESPELTAVRGCWHLGQLWTVEIATFVDEPTMRLAIKLMNSSIPEASERWRPWVESWWHDKNIRTPGSER